MKKVLGLLLVVVPFSAGASYLGCGKTEFGFEAETVLSCKSVRTGEEVCVRQGALLGGKNLIQVKNQSDSYNQYFDQSGSASSCELTSNYCVRSEITTTGPDLVGRLVSLDLASIRVHHADFRLDKTTATGVLVIIDDTRITKDEIKNCEVVP